MEDILEMVKEHQRIWKSFKAMQNVIALNDKIISDWKENTETSPPPELGESINISEKIIALYEEFKIIHLKIVNLLNENYFLFDKYILLNEYLENEEYSKAEAINQEIKNML